MSASQNTDWYLFYLSHLDNVRISNSNIAPDGWESLPYKRFTAWIASLGVIHYFEMLEQLNKYNTILYETKTQNWRIIESERNVSDLTFEDMAKLNQDVLEYKKKDAIQTEEISKIDFINKKFKGKLNKIKGGQ